MQQERQHTTGTGNTMQKPDALSVLVLGSGGPAAVGRASSGYIVFVDGEAHLLIDAGSGIFTRIGEAHVDLTRLQAVFLTHFHIDHAVELPAILLARAMASGGTIHFQLYGPKGSGVYPSTSQFVHQIFDTGGIFAYQKSFQVTETISAVDLPREADRGVQDIYVDGNVIVQTVATRHGPVPANAYRVNYQGQSIVFSGDFDPSSIPVLTQLAQGATLLICTCDVLDPPGSNAELYALHTPPHQIGELAMNAHARALLLSHLSPAIVQAQEQVEQSIRQSYQGEIQFASDLLRISPLKSYKKILNGQKFSM